MLAEPTTRRFLVSRWADGWLVGGIGVAVWILFSMPSWGGPSFTSEVSGPLYWILIAISGTHFGVSYHLAYGQGRDVVRRRWPALVATPAVLALLSFAFLVAAIVGSDRVADEGVRLLLAMVFTLTSWHYIKQVYGVARVGASLQGLSIDRSTVLVLRYGLYPLWLVQAVAIWGGDGGASFNGFAASYDLLPTWIEPIFTVCSYGAAVLLVGAFLHLCATWRRLPPASVWTPYAVGFLWFLFPPSYVSAALVFGALHALQYLACAHRAEVEWGVERGATASTWWWSCVFGGALATGMLLVYWLPQWLTNVAGTSAVGLAPVAMLFAFFNLHHYAVDASIWRFGGDHVRRIVHGPDI